MFRVSAAILVLFGSISPVVEACTEAASPCCYREMERSCCGERPDGDHCFCNTEKPVQATVEIRQLVPQVNLPIAANNSLEFVKPIAVKLAFSRYQVLAEDLNAFICVFLC